jgi:hypothetical protein
LDGTARLWLEDSLQPLDSNPVLRHGERVAHAAFSPDSRGIATTCADGSVRIWDLAGCAALLVDDRPIEDLRQLAQLFSGETDPRAGGLSPPQSESLRDIWQRLRAKYPSSFATTAPEISAWHKFEAENCEAQRQWFAAAFHLRRLMTISPALRLARANEQFGSGN